MGNSLQLISSLCFLRKALAAGRLAALWLGQEMRGGAFPGGSPAKPPVAGAQRFPPGLPPGKASTQGPCRSGGAAVGRAVAGSRACSLEVGAERYLSLQAPGCALLSVS